MNTPELDQRIDRLEKDLARERSTRHADKDGHQSLLLELKEIKLNLAQQDRMLARLDVHINGNGRPGLILRMDRAERWIAANSRLLWMLAGTTLALAVHGFWSRL
jgi:hypothetical protein